MLVKDRFNVAKKEEAICCCFEHFDTKKKKNIKNYIGFLLHLFIQNKKQCIVSAIIENKLVLLLLPFL